MTDYFRLRFYGSYNLSACTVLVIYDFILENFFLKINPRKVLVFVPYITNEPPFSESMFLAQK